MNAKDKNRICQFAARYARNACDSWSGQDVLLKPQRMPDKREIASVTVIPRISAATPCVFPAQPP